MKAMFNSRIFGVLIVVYVFWDCAFCESNFFLKAAKNVPRIGRSNNKSNNIEEMGKFFMKASKSVPRIGRRNDEVPDGNFNIDRMRMLANMDKRNPLFWSNLAEKLEYEPELFANPEFIDRLEEFSDDPSNNWEKLRFRRNTQSGGHQKLTHKIKI